MSLYDVQALSESRHTATKPEVLVLTELRIDALWGPVLDSDYTMYFGEVMYYDVLPNAHMPLCIATILQLRSVTLTLSAICYSELHNAHVRKIHDKLLVVILYIQQTLCTTLMKQQH
jgi:hypothetical protein